MDGRARLGIGVTRRSMWGAETPRPPRRTAVWGCTGTEDPPGELAALPGTRPARHSGLPLLLGDPEHPSQSASPKLISDRPGETQHFLHYF